MSVAHRDHRLAVVGTSTTSACTNVASPPAARIGGDRRSPASSTTSVTTTRAPSAANSSAADAAHAAPGAGDERDLALPDDQAFGASGHQSTNFVVVARAGRRPRPAAASVTASRRGSVPSDVGRPCWSVTGSRLPLFTAGIDEPGRAVGGQVVGVAFARAVDDRSPVVAQLCNALARVGTIGCTASMRSTIVVRITVLLRVPAVATSSAVGCVGRAAGAPSTRLQCASHTVATAVCAVLVERSRATVGPTENQIA